MGARWQCAYGVLIGKQWRTLSFDEPMVSVLHPRVESFQAEFHEGGRLKIAANRADIDRPAKYNIETSIDCMKDKLIGLYTSQVSPTMEPCFTRRANDELVI